MKNKKHLKILSSLVFVLAIFAGYQNCVQQGSGGGRKSSSTSSSSSSGGSASGSVLSLSYTEPGTGIVWNYSYEHARDVLNISIGNSSITPSDGFSLNMQITDLEQNNCQANALLGTNSLQTTVEMIVLACLDLNLGRVYLSSQSRSPAGSGNWSSPLAHGVLCYSGSCPVSMKATGFQDTQGTNWAHFFSREDNGAYQIAITRLSQNHSPNFALYQQNDLRHGDNYLEYLRVSEVDSGDVYDFYFDLLLNEYDESIAISHKRELIESSTQDVVPGNMSTPFPHGVIDL